MESWRNVWRNALCPLLSSDSLQALHHGLLVDDLKIIQGATTSPPPLQCVQGWKPEAACVIGYCGWQGEGLETVGEVESFFAAICCEIDQRMGEPAGCRWFLNVYDDWTREEMRRELLAEVELALAQCVA